MLSDKIGKLKQDLVEVKGKFEGMGIDNTSKDLKESIDILEEDLRSYLETIENALVDLR